MVRFQWAVFFRLHPKYVVKILHFATFWRMMQREKQDFIYRTRILQFYLSLYLHHMIVTN